MADIHSFPLTTAGARKERAPAKKEDRPAKQWVCNICKHDIGVATSEIMQTIVCPMVKGGKVVGGTKRKICAECHRRGKVTVV